VAIIAIEIAKAYGLTRQETNNIFLALTILFYEREKIAALEFEVKNPYLHAERGYLLSKDFQLFEGIAKIIRCHHVPWENGKGIRFGGEDVHIGSHIIHLADRVDVLIDKQQEILSQNKKVVDAIKSRSNSIFVPEIVEAFENLSAKESFWFDAASPDIKQIILDRNVLLDTELNIDELMNIAKLFSHIIDYRSPFTAIHSAGVSEVATILAQMIGFSDIECQMMRVAGYLHDIGKLGVPSEILEKPAKLSVEESNAIKSHAYHSYRILGAVSGLDIINTWASLHHERMDGKGYPFHIKEGELPIGSRIIAVADVFTAITEDRPYRKGMSGEEALRIIENMVKNNSLDQSIVGVTSTYFRHLEDIRINAQSKAAAEYMAIKQFMV